ncbi:MAG: hypothetical protein U9Q71_02005 [Pseudomonadota bacterium]|nr:hypothetical protein [Pseudomonadota bacterium]
MAKKSALADLLQKSTDTPKKEVFTGQVTAERQVRLNINIPESLLKRIRIAAAEQGTSMTKLLIPILEREFNE